MKKKSSGILCLVLAFAMVFMLALSGCGQSASSEEESTESSVEDVVESVSSAEDDTEDRSTEEAGVQDNNDVPQETAEPQAIPYSEEQLTYSVFLSAPNTNNFISGYEDYTSIQYLEKQANVKFDFTEASFEAFDTQWSLMVASGDLYDILRNGVDVFSGGLTTAVSEEIIIDLSSYVEDYMPNYYDLIYNSENSADIKRDLLYDGEVLGLFTIKEEPVFDIGGSIIRADWLEELGLDVPYTYEEYTEVLLAFMSEYDLSMPYVLSSATQNQRSTMIQAFGTGGVVLDGHRSGTHYYHNNGEVYSSLNSDEYRAYLSQMHQWYDLGIITSDFINVSDMTDNSDRVGYALNGDAGIWYGKPSDLTTTYADGASSDPNFRAQAIAGPFVSADQTETYFNEYCSYVLTDMVTYVSTKCENVEFLLSLADWCYSEYGGMFCTWGVQGETWDYDNNGEFVVTDEVWNNTWDLTESAYIGYHNFSLWGYTMAVNSSNYFYTDEQVAAIELWDVGNQDHAIGNLDPTVYLEEYSALIADIDTYALETITKFIVGELDVDGNDWDEWCETLDAMDLQRTIDAMQQAVDVWLGE